MKRECPPRPPKEKRGGISISPRTPLKRHKGAKLRFLPFGNPPKDKGSGSGKGGRGCPLCTLRFDATISTAYKAGQALHPARDLVRNSSPAQQFSQNPFPPNLHLCASLEQTLFLFHRARRIFFLAFQKENGGVHSGRQSLHPCGGSPHPLWSTVPAEAEKMGIQFCMISPCFPVPQGGTPLYDLVS